MSEVQADATTPQDGELAEEASLHQRFTSFFSEEDKDAGDAKDPKAAADGNAVDAGEEEVASVAGDEDGKPEAKDPKETESPRRLHKLKIDGKEIEVDDEELKRGYNLATYNTQRSQKLAEQEKALKAHEAALSAERARYAEMLPQLEQHIESQLDPYAGVDWERLRQEDPAHKRHKVADRPQPGRGRRTRGDLFDPDAAPRLHV